MRAIHNVSELGFTVRAIPPDGQCFWHCILKAWEGTVYPQKDSYKGICAPFPPTDMEVWESGSYTDKMRCLKRSVSEHIGAEHGFFWTVENDFNQSLVDLKRAFVHGSSIWATQTTIVAFHTAFPHWKVIILELCVHGYVIRDIACRSELDWDPMDRTIWVLYSGAHYELLAFSDMPHGYRRVHQLPLDASQFLQNHVGPIQTSFAIGSVDSSG